MISQKGRNINIAMFEEQWKPFFENRELFENSDVKGVKGIDIIDLCYYNKCNGIKKGATITSLIFTTAISISLGIVMFVKHRNKKLSKSNKEEQK